MVGDLFRSLDRLTRAVANPALRLLSLDLFDTLLLRETTPELIRLGGIARIQHQALERAGFRSPGATSLYRARLWCQKQLYDAAALVGNEVRHDEILRAMCYRCALDLAVLPELVRAEVAYEASHLRPNRLLLAWLVCVLEQPRAIPLRVVLVSDMYLAVPSIRSLLLALTPALVPCPLYVSAECQCSKRRGTLFPFVSAAEHVSPDHSLHIGDHPLADGVQAERSGWRAETLPRDFWWRKIHHVRDRWARRTLARRGWLYTS